MNYVDESINNTSQPDTCAAFALPDQIKEFNIPLNCGRGLQSREGINGGRPFCGFCF
jgi:hypothetical protein